MVEVSQEFAKSIDRMLAKGWLDDTVSAVLEKLKPIHHEGIPYDAVYDIFKASGSENPFRQDRGLDVILDSFEKVNWVKIDRENKKIYLI